MVALLMLLQSDVGLQVEAGFSSTVVEDGWNRATVTVDARARPFKGTLEFLQGDDVASFAVDQLGGSTRRYWWDFFVAEYAPSLRVRLIDEEGVVAAEQSILLRDLDRRPNRVLVVGPAPSSIKQAEQTARLAWTATTAPQLPTSPVPLLGYDTIVMMRPEDLDSWQQEALRRWIEFGGRLVLATGREYAAVRHGFWKEISPVAVRNLTTERDGETVRLVTVGDRLRGAAILGGSGTRARHGSGEIVFLSFAIDTKSTADPQAAGAFWRTLLNEEEPEEIADRWGRVRLQWGSAPSRVTVEELMDDLSTGRTPFSAMAVMQAAGVVAAFLAIVGPFSYFRLRRRSRRRAAGAFFVALAVSCAAIAAIGSTFEVGETRLRHTVIVEDGVIQTFTTLQASEGIEYAFAHEGAALAVPYVRRVHEWRQEEARRTTMPVPLMRAARLVTARVVDRGAFDVSCRWIDPSARVVEIRNDGDLSLTECAVVTVRTTHFVGDVAPGARLRVDLDEVESATTESWARARAAEDRDALSLGLYGLNVDATGRVWELPRQRTISAAARIAAGEAVFVGRFDRDVTGIKVEPSMPVAVDGLLRARVEDADEGD